jgi:hypothetical protein
MGFVLDDTTSTKTVMTLTREEYLRERELSDRVHVVRFSEQGDLDD